jgi:very-short-patch-repair endonuclease
LERGEVLEIKMVFPFANPGRLSRVRYYGFIKNPSPCGRGKGEGDSRFRMSTSLTNYAKRLRKNSTRAEAILWNKLKARQMEGIKFRRQQPIDNFIVDFVSFEKRIVIELDGGQHKLDKNKDSERDRMLTESGFKVLRFWNNEIFENLNGVLEVIRQLCNR